MHMCLLWECEVMSPFLKQDELQVKGVHWAVVTLHPGSSRSGKMTPRLWQWLLRVAQGVCVPRGLAAAAPLHIQAPCSIANTFHCFGYSSSCNRAQGSCLFPGYKYSSKWPMPQEPGGLLEFLLQVLAGTLTRGQVKPVPLCHAHSSTASSLLHYKSFCCLILMLFSSQDSVSALLGLLSVLGGRQRASGKRRKVFLVEADFWPLGLIGATTNLSFLGALGLLLQ